MIWRDSEHVCLAKEVREQGLETGSGVGSFPNSDSNGSRTTVTV